MSVIICLFFLILFLSLSLLALISSHFSLAPFDPSLLVGVALLPSDPGRKVFLRGGAARSGVGARGRSLHCDNNLSQKFLLITRHAIVAGDKNGKGFEKAELGARRHELCVSICLHHWPEFSFGGAARVAK